jgi:hypothetical protein
LIPVRQIFGGFFPDKFETVGGIIENDINKGLSLVFINDLGVVAIYGQTVVCRVHKHQTRRIIEGSLYIVYIIRNILDLVDVAKNVVCGIVAIQIAVFDSGINRSTIGEIMGQIDEVIPSVK